MTAAKYKRLCLVLIVPLLLIGWLLAAALDAGGTSVRVLCIPSYTFENCRPVGDGELYRSVRDESNLWFDVIQDREPETRVSELIEASGRLVPVIRIVDASSLHGYGPDVAAYVKQLVGRTGYVQLGTAESVQSIVASDVGLSCSNLFLFPKEQLFGAQCWGEGWGAFFKFKEISSGQGSLASLQEAVQDLSDERRKVRSQSFMVAVMLPMLVFFLLSVAFWGSSRAIAYVKGTDQRS